MLHLLLYCEKKRGRITRQQHCFMQHGSFIHADSRCFSVPELNSKMAYCSQNRKRELQHQITYMTAQLGKRHIRNRENRIIEYPALSIFIILFAAVWKLRGTFGLRQICLALHMPWTKVNIFWVP